MEKIEYLSLFSGVEGNGLAFQHLLGFKCKGYVEIDDFCQKLINQRRIDNLLDEAPIFSDINAFISEGYAKEYKGMVNLITAGFPCQAHSIAAKRLGKLDDRNMWPQTIKTVQIIEPVYVFLENVVGLLSSESSVDAITRRPISYCTTIFRDLAEAGYDAKWTTLGCHNLGGFHKRDRIWILATNNRSKRIQRIIKKKIPWFYTFPWRKNVRGLEDIRKRSDIPEPIIWRVGHGIPNYLDRIKAIGNAQCPQVAATAWEILKP